MARHCIIMHGRNRYLFFAYRAFFWLITSMVQHENLVGSQYPRESLLLRYRLSGRESTRLTTALPIHGL